jgi:hypothetical protein
VERRSIARVTLAVVPLVALFALWAQCGDHSRMPPLEEVERLNSLVRDGWRPGDAVRVEPIWFDAARVGLPEANFLLGYEPDAWDRHLVKRLWLLVAGTGSESGIDRWRPWLDDVQTIAIGDRYTVLRSSVSNVEQIEWDALHAIPTARVAQRDENGTVQECTTRRGVNVYCGQPNPWVFIGPVIREMDDTYRYCVSASVPERGRTWIIEWDDIPRSQILRLRAGNSQWAARMPRGSAVTVRTWIDDTPWFERTWAIDEVGYPEFTHALSPSDDPVRLRLELQADDHTDRYFCFRAQSLANPQGHR